VNSRTAGEALIWLGIVALLCVAGGHRNLTGNEFVGLFAIGAAALVTGLVLTFGERRWPR
jgi:hypothetical protein